MDSQDNLNSVLGFRAGWPKCVADPHVWLVNVDSGYTCRFDDFFTVATVGHCLGFRLFLFLSHGEIQDAKLNCLLPTRFLLLYFYHSELIGNTIDEPDAQKVGLLLNKPSRVETALLITLTKLPHILLTELQLCSYNCLQVILSPLWGQILISLSHVWSSHCPRLLMVWGGHVTQSGLRRPEEKPVSAETLGKCFLTLKEETSGRNVVFWLVVVLPAGETEALATCL